MLSDQEIERYARHIVLREVGGPGQARLKAARVLVIGAGGLGSPVLQYLAAAGIGTLDVVDDDVVSLSNLQRQVIYTGDDIGQSKALRAAAHLEALNPHVKVVPHHVRLTKDNAAALIAPCDLVLDGSDNFETRYLAADTCAALKKTLVTSAVGRFDGSITTLKPWGVDASGAPNPTYRDLFPHAPPPGTVPACAEAGILGALTGIMGTLMAMEAIKEIAGIGEGLVGRLLMVDAFGARFDVIAYKRGE